MKVEELKDRVRCQDIIVLINAPRYLEMQSKYMIVNAQMDGATKIVLNKVDLADEDLLIKTRQRVNEVKPAGASLLESSYGEVDLDRLFSGFNPRAAAREEDTPSPAGHDEDHDHDHGDSTDKFASFSLKRVEALAYADVIAFFKAKGDCLVRAKGIIETELGNKLVQYSSNGLDVSDYAKDQAGAELVFITLKGDEDMAKAGVTEYFGWNEGIGVQNPQ